MDRYPLWILFALVGEQLGRRFLHPYFGVVFVPLVLSAMVVTERWRRRHARRRLRQVGELPEEEQRAAADALPHEEQSAARLTLGLIDPAVDSPKQEEIFAYSRGQLLTVALAYWGCVSMAIFVAGMGYLQQIATRPDFWPWVGVVLGFLGGAILMQWARQQQRTRFFVNQFAIGEIKPSGARKTILWTQLTRMRNRPWTFQVEFHGGVPMRKVAVPYHIDGFPRFMELVAAQLRLLYPPESAQPASESHVEAREARVPADAAPAPSRVRKTVRVGLVALLLGAIWLLARTPGLGLTHRIDDRASFLDRSAVGGFENYLRQVYRESGVDIRIVFVDTVPGGDALEAFAVREARAVGIGRDLDSRGVLLVYDVTRQRLRIEVGPALQNILTDRFVGSLARDQVRNVFAAANPTAGLRLTLLLLHARLRRAALGEEYDPRVADYIEDGRWLANGGGASASMSETEGQTEFPSQGASADARKRFRAQPTVEEAYRRYLEWLRGGEVEVNVDLFTQPSQSYLAAVPGRQAYTDYVLFLEYGRQHRILVRGNLALMYFTDDPLVCPHFFRHTDLGWQLDLVAEARDSRNFIGGPWTWSLVDRNDEFSRAFFDRYTAIGPILRLAGGDNRPIPTRATDMPRWPSRPGASAPPGVEQLTVTEAAERIAELRGRPAVVVLYRTWDGVSERQFPGIVQFARRCRAAGAEVLAFSIDENWNAVRELPGFLRQHDAPFAPVRLYHWPNGMLTRAMAPLGIRIGAQWSPPLVAVLGLDGGVTVQTEGAVPTSGCP